MATSKQRAGWIVQKLFALVPYLIALVSLLASILNFSEFFNVAIQKEIGAYPWGPSGDAPWYYQSPRIYSTYNMVVGLLLLAAATLIFRGRHKKNKTFKVAGLVWAILILLFCTAGCISNKYPQATTEINIHKVYIENLANNRTKYHGATVQVRGLFGYAFETCAIFPATPDYKDGNIVYKISSFEAIWLEFDSKYIPFDSIANYDYSKMHQLITVQGVFDSTKTGHMGEYKGTIRNARIVIDN